MKVKIVGVPGGSSKTRKVRISGVPQAQAGGEMPETHGLPSDLHHMANVEAEQGEVYQDRQGDYNKISDDAATHEQGGVMIPDAERVLENTSTMRKDKHSKKLKMSPKEIQTIFGVKVKRPLSHAEAFEVVTKDYDKQREKVNTAQAGINDLQIMDKPAFNSAKLNFNTRDKLIPSNDHVFDTLFDHQEAIKAAHDIPNDGQAKYGGYKRKFTPKAQTGSGVQPYKGGSTAAGSTTPTGNSNKFQYDGGLDAFKNAWSNIINLDQYDNAADAQAATYDWLVKNQPDVAASIWQEQGLTAKGRRMMDPKSKEYDPKFAKAAAKIFDKSGKVKEGVDLNAETLGAIAPAYKDNMLGIRSVTPSQFTQQEQTPPPGQAQQQPPARQQPPAKQPNVTLNPRFINQPKNKFYEPTHWYDVAPATAELVDSLNRDPELYNPIQLHQLKYKLLNPTAALNANQADYEAATQALGNENIGSGAAAANLSNLTAQKYRANNQVLADYENKNAMIQNQEIAYNTNVRDRQSLADAESREKFYTNVLRGRDNQRLQKLQAIQDISRVQQLKARQNKSGNLILKMTPAFDQNGEYSGYQYVPVLPPEMGGGEFIPQAQPTKAAKPTSRTTTTFKVGDKTVKTTNSN